MLALSSERTEGPLRPRSGEGHMPLGGVERRAEARIKSEKAGKCWLVLSFGIQGLKFGVYSKWGWKPLGHLNGAVTNFIL